MINAFVIDDRISLFQVLNTSQDEIQFYISEELHPREEDIKLYDLLIKLFEEANELMAKDEIDILLIDNAMDGIKGLEDNNNTWISDIFNNLEENDKLLQLISNVRENVPIAVFSGYEGERRGLQNILESKLGTTIYRVSKSDLDQGKYILEIKNILEN